MHVSKRHYPSTCLCLPMWTHSSTVIIIGDGLGGGEEEDSNHLDSFSATSQMGENLGVLAGRAFISVCLPALMGT